MSQYICINESDIFQQIPVSCKTWFPSEINLSSTTISIERGEVDTDAG
jgi:hypothetical protein